MKKSAITSAIVAVVVLVFVRLFQVNQMPPKGHSEPTSDEKQIESFQQTVIWATNQESGDLPNVGSDHRKISGNAPASPPDLGLDAGIGNPAARAVRVPPGWLERQSDYVRNAVSNKQFVTSKEGVLGVIDASGRFVTWPGAPSNSARF
jgi:hypothetical protein